MAKQQHFTFLFAKTVATGKKLLSVELYSNIPYDLDAVNGLNPSFCSLTWNHGDLSKPETLDTIILGKKLNENSRNMLMHVCGRNFKREEALNIINKIKEMGVKNILALKGGSAIIESDDSKCEFPYGLEFLQFLRNEYDDHFNIGTSGYPIGHPTSEDPIKDISYLKRKVDAGADFVVCQGVFDLQTFKNFYRRCRELHIDVPILPAVYAINSYSTLKNLMGFCKIVPSDYLETMEKYQNDEEEITNYSVKYVSDLIKELLTDKDISVPGVHVFCFNNFSLVEKIFGKLDFSQLKIWRP